MFECFTFPCFGIAVWNTASTEKVPLPCIGTVVQVSWLTPVKFAWRLVMAIKIKARRAEYFIIIMIWHQYRPATFSNSDRTSFTVWMKSTSLEPRSLCIACLIVELHSNGPGVNSFLSLAEKDKIKRKWVIIHHDC